MTIVSKEMMNRMIAATGLDRDEIQTWCDIADSLGLERSKELRDWLRSTRIATEMIKRQPFFK